MSIPMSARSDRSFYPETEKRKKKYVWVYVYSCRRFMQFFTISFTLKKKQNKKNSSVLAF